MSRFRLTPKRRQSILKAAKVSAQRRRSKGLNKNQVGYWIAKGVRKGGDKATLGVAGYVVALKDLSESQSRKRKRRRRG